MGASDNEVLAVFGAHNTCSGSKTAVYSKNDLLQLKSGAASLIRSTMTSYLL